MQLFLKKIFFFTAIVTVLCLLLQAFVSFRINGGFKKENKGILEQSGNVDAELVLLGSSRCWMQLDPVFFEATFEKKTANLGINGHGEISMAYTRLADYLQRNTPPEFAILCFDPFVTAGDTLQNTNFFIKDAFAEYAFLPSAKDKLMVNYFDFNFCEKYIPLYAAFKYRLFHKAFTAAGVNKQMATGNEIYKEVWDTIARPVDRTGKHIPTVKNFEANQLEVSLAGLNELCRRNNIRLLCLQLPVHESMYDPEVFSLTAAISKKAGIPFVDACDSSIMNGTHFFYNSNHLNKAGIQRMNDLLKNNTALNRFLKPL